ncbi:MAG TPA: Dickkopf N-terminal cysteine-rich domain-containing protein [Candidatus Nanopelagicales bacterium]|nr:Dickkopf N-terminal cysteine-rich domain-containing protein [Candidatus Nanopelagicales bacterium]
MFLFHQPWFRLAALGGLALAAAAPGCSCGGDDDPPPGPATSPEAQLAEELCVATTYGFIHLARAARHVLEQPSVEDPIASIFSPAALEELRAGCATGEPLHDAWFTAISGGRVAIDTEALARCRAKADAARAGATLAQAARREGPLAALVEDPDCAGILTGQAEGAACVQHWDCAPGLFCQADDGEDELTCKPPAAAGEGCGPTRDCGEGTACVAGACQPPAALGEACGPDAPTCGAGLFCDTATELCAARKAAGEACALRGECAEGLACREGACATARAAVADGAPCTAGEDLCSRYTSVCRPGAPGGATQCLDRGGAGAACAEEDHCRIGFTCAAGACAALPGAGEACAGACRDALHCNGAGVCAAPLATGAACQAGDLCLSGYCGAAGACERFPGYGEACGANGAPPVCREGACVGGACVGGRAGDTCEGSRACGPGLACTADFTCAPLPGEGQPSLDGACGPGLFASASDTCEPAGEVGAPCAAPIACLSRQCRKDGTCGPAPASILTQRDASIRAFVMGFAP